MLRGTSRCAGTAGTSRDLVPARENTLKGNAEIQRQVRVHYRGWLIATGVGNSLRVHRIVRRHSRVYIVWGVR